MTTKTDTRTRRTKERKRKPQRQPEPTLRKTPVRRIQNDKCLVCRTLFVDNDTIYWPARGYLHRKCWKRRAEISKRRKYKKSPVPAITIKEVDLNTGAKKVIAKEYYSLQGRKYQKYISSPAWAAKRAEYWRFYGYSCKAKDCQATVDLHVHHHTYQRLGNERLSDLVGLCIPHHDAVHAHHDTTGRRESLTRSTEVVTGLKLQK